VFAGTHRSVLIAVLVAATGLAAFWPAMHAYTMATLGAANRGGDFGAIRSLFIGVGALGPAAVGVLAERTTFDVAYLGLACCLLASAAVVYWLVRRDIE